jgi:hypothetical protein
VALDDEKRSDVFSFSFFYPFVRNQVDGWKVVEQEGNNGMFSPCGVASSPPEVKLGLGTAEDGARSYSLLFPEASEQPFEPGIHRVGGQAATDLYKVTTKEVGGKKEREEGDRS